MMIITIISVNAETITLQYSIDDSSNYANLLTDIMINDESYDPLDEYAIVRSGEYSYDCYFAPSLQNEKVTRLRYIVYHNYTPAQLTRQTVDKVKINGNGYIYVGNIKGSASSTLQTEYKFKSVIISIAILLAIIILFSIFRKKMHISVKGYRI